MTKEDILKEIEIVDAQIENAQRQAFIADGARQAFLYILKKLEEEEAAPPVDAEGGKND